MIVFTNNPKVRSAFYGSELKFVEGQYLDVLIKVRDEIHKHFKLLTHPLSGSIKPNETPYKSIAIEPCDMLDINSLMMIENAILVHDKLVNDKPTPEWSDRILEDFMIIDLDLFYHAVVKSV
jgi:hypothetical protein